MAKQHPITSSQGRFNTLAQNGTASFSKPAIIVNGNGSKLSNVKAMKGRAKRKLITQTMMLSLIGVAEKYGSKDRVQAYWNTYHCQNKLFTVNDRLHGKYCKNRFCTLCCSIRKAEILNKYLPFIKTWERPFFVTLTIKARPLRNLHKFMKGMLQAFEKIFAKLKKRQQRGKGKKIIGIKSLECNFNATKKTYNPHFHLILANEETANILIAEWLKIWTSKFATRAAQDKRKIANLETALIEVVKYGSKIFTEPDLNKKGQGKSDPNIYVAALDNIFNSMQGLRIFERFGFNLPKGARTKETKSAIAKEYNEWIYDLRYSDWLNSENEAILTAYLPDTQLINLLENNIDKKLE